MSATSERREEAEPVAALQDAAGFGGDAVDHYHAHVGGVDVEAAKRSATVAPAGTSTVRTPVGASGAACLRVA
jgi:hypothetical protein